MTVEDILSKFELLADAPKAIQKLRGLVLELATQGRLVEQVASEGNGSELLKEIRAKHAEDETETRDEESQSSFPAIPTTWAYASLGEVTSIIRGVTFPASAKATVRGKGDVACLRTASVQAEIDWDDLIYIAPSHVGREGQWVAVNDVIISMANSYDLVGKVAVVREVPQKATFGGFLAAIRPIRIHPYFLLYVLRSPHMQAAFRASSSQTTNIANISLGRMRPLPFPLPPLAEQQRIVAKVDELMALCDRLEAQQKEREAKHAVLARAALARFAEAPTPANLGYLFHYAYTIDPADLRKSILTMAVQGKLAMQHERDGTASELLEQLGDAQECATKKKRAKRTKDLRDIDEARSGYTIPPTWTWARLGDVVLEFRYGTSRKCDRSTTGVPVLRIPNVQSGRVDSTDLKYTEMPKAEFAELSLRPGDLLLVRSNGSESLVGRSAVASTGDERFAYAGYLVRARASQDHVFSPYIHLALSESAVREQIEGPIRTTSGVKNLNTTELANLVFPLPPLAEQRRIVAKVDALMALVDRLEAQLAESRALAGRLMEAVVAELTAADRHVGERQLEESAR
jgi:type I restriction enzyme, S subunit